MANALSNRSAVHFTAQAPQRANQAQLQAFRQGLEALIVHDRTQHENPVLERVNIDALTRQGDAFLQRQAKAGQETPTPFLIGIAGGTASGKSFVKNIWHKLFPANAEASRGWNQADHGDVVSEIELDNYYKDTAARRQQLGDADYFLNTDLDSPTALSLDQAAKDVTRLKNGRAIRHQRHHFPDSSSIPGATLKAPTPFFFVEGLFALAHKPLRNLMDMRVFVDAHEEVRTERWWKRAPERNIHPNEAGRALFKRAMDAHNDHVQPSKIHANVVLNGTADPVHLKEVLDTLTGLMIQTFHP